MRKEQKLGWGIQLGYGAGSIADNAVYNFIVSFLSFYMTTMAGVSPIVAGGIISFAVFWDAVTDPIVGILIDCSRSKYGKRRPFIIGSVIPMCTAVILLFLNTGFSGTAKNIYYLVLVLVFWTSYTVFNIPYYSLGAAITSDDNERTKLSALRQGLGYLGVFFGSSLSTFLVGKFVAFGIENSLAWTYAATITAIIIAVCITITWRATRGREAEDVAEAENRSLKEVLREMKELVCFKPYALIIISAFCSCVTFAFIDSDLMYFATYVLGLNEVSASVVYTALTIFGIILIPVIAKVALKWDKRNTYIGCMIFSGLVMTAMKFIGIRSLTQMIVYMGLYSIGYGAYWMFIFNLLYDVVDIDELKCGRRRDGAIFSYYSFLLKLGGAAAAWILGVVLQSTGFDPDASVQSVHAIRGITSLFTIYPGIFMILSGAVILFSPLNKTVTKAVRDALVEKQKGKEYNTETFKHLL